MPQKDEAIAEIIDHKIGILIEHMNDQFDRVLEAVGGTQEKADRIPYIEEKVDKLDQDVKVIKAAVTDASRQLDNHEHRITQLEATA